MHAKSDSEVTSLPGSSPPRSPRSHGLLLRQPPPAYYVQSPSRDSHDGGDSKLSFQSTPLLSPVGSPLHPLATASATSDAARSSTSSMPPAAARKHHHHHHSRARVQPQPASTPTSVTSSTNNSRTIDMHHDAYHKKLLPSTIYEDEEEYGATASKPSSIAPQIYTFLFVILSCIVFLFVFILLFWLICRPSRPALSIKNIVFHNLYMAQGTDASGVPSMLLTVNSTVQIDYDNRSRYFGAHLDPLAVDFDYSELTVASSQMDGYVQGKSSRKVISMGVKSIKVPLYGASALTNAKKPSVPLNATISVCSRYYIVGQMVKSRFCSSIVCNLDVSSSSMALLTPLKKACTYDPPLLQ